MEKIASTRKIAYHSEKINAYLSNEDIRPTTLELDITSACNRSCRDCPSTTDLGKYDLEIELIDKLFCALNGETRGLLLTGGEPTLAPVFPDVLDLAGKHGFEEIAVVTNGSFLDKEPVVDSLLENASVVRVSLYDWPGEGGGDANPVLKNIENLRSRAEIKKSDLQIGVSLLTSEDKVDQLEFAVHMARDAGAHWAYFHPTCTNWDQGKPFLVSQRGVLEKIREIRNKKIESFTVMVYDDRYLDTEIFFNGYHSAHFLMVVGADGMNYLGAEVKYQPLYAIWNLRDNWKNDFFWDEIRTARIRSVKSDRYPPIMSRHRGVLYNDYIQRLMGKGSKEPGVIKSASSDALIHPNIL